MAKRVLAKGMGGGESHENFHGLGGLLGISVVQGALHHPDGPRNVGGRHAYVWVPGRVGWCLCLCTYVRSSRARAQAEPCFDRFQQSLISCSVRVFTCTNKHTNEVCPAMVGWLCP